MDNRQIARDILNMVGTENIIEVYNCMTRLRLRVKAVSVTKDDFKKIAGVKGVILSDTEIHVVLGPGKAKSVTEECRQFLKQNTKTDGTVCNELQSAATGKEQPANTKNPCKTVAGKMIPPIRNQNFGHAEELHYSIKKRNSSSSFKQLLQRVGHIFIPLIPAFIGCGLLTGVLSMILRISPDTAAAPIFQYLKLAGGSVFSVLNAFVGLYACKEFGGTPALGGAMAALLAAPGLGDISLFGSTLIPGRGGVFASLLTGMATALIETRLRKHIPEAASLFITPFATIIVIALTSILIFQPVGGFISDLLGYYTIHAIQTEGAIAGFVIGGIFLPVVMAGVHHGLTPIHADLLTSTGMTVLLPIVAMAGCGQVGASFAVYLKTKNKALKKTILSSLPIGMMGIGEPLIYGVTLPLGKPFIGACIGGAFGGAWQACHSIGAFTIGISGLPLAPATNHILLYLVGVLIAYVAGFVATLLTGFDDPPEENSL